MPAASLDADKMNAFAEKMMGVLNSATVAMMCSLGHRTGLFDAMSRLTKSATTKQIAAESKLNERYVREWLGTMVTANVVEYDDAAKTYRLPPEHAAFLTRAATPNNMAAGMQFFAIFGIAEDKLVEAFRTGRGVPYSAYPRFHEVMAEMSAQTIVSALHDHIIPLAPGLADRLKAGIDVIDIGCGSGRAMIELAKKYPASRFAGYDFSPEAIEPAQADAKRQGVKNVRFEVRDLAEMNEPGRYDLVTAFDAIHDQSKPDKVLANIRAALKPGGVFLMQDISGSSHLATDMKHPLAPFLYGISCMHCMSVSLFYGGPGLGAMWGKDLALCMLSEAGLTKVDVKTLPHDPMNFYYVATAG